MNYDDQVNYKDLLNVYDIQYNKRIDTNMIFNDNINLRNDKNKILVN